MLSLRLPSLLLLFALAGPLAALSMEKASRGPFHHLFDAHPVLKKRSVNRAQYLISDVDKYFRKEFPIKHHPVQFTKQDEIVRNVVHDGLRSMGEVVVSLMQHALECAYSSLPVSKGCYEDLLHNIEGNDEQSKSIKVGIKLLSADTVAIDQMFPAKPQRKHRQDDSTLKDKSNSILRRWLMEGELRKYMVELRRRVDNLTSQSISPESRIDHEHHMALIISSLALQLKVEMEKYLNADFLGRLARESLIKQLGKIYVLSYAVQQAIIRRPARECTDFDRENLRELLIHYEKKAEHTL